MVFRIGINLGEIIHKNDRIYGDGVNIAARIENLADPGGICISRGVFDQVDSKLDVGFADLGPHSVKNIRKPVNIYKVLLDPKDAGKIVDATKAKEPDSAMDGSCHPWVGRSGQRCWHLASSNEGLRSSPPQSTV